MSDIVGDSCRGLGCLCVAVIRIFTLEPCWKSLSFKTNNKGYMLSKVNDDGYNLRYASDDLKNDKEVVIEAVRNEWRALGFASNLMKMDTDVIIQAITSGCRLADLSNNIYGNKEVIMEAVQHEGTALQLAAEELRNDKTVVYAAVRNDGTALQYASKMLKNDESIVLEAVKKNGSALRYASDSLRGNFEVVASAVKADSTALKFALGGLKRDEEVLIVAGLWDEENELRRKSTAEAKPIKNYALAHAPAHAPVHAPAHAPVHAPAHTSAHASAHGSAHASLQEERLYNDDNEYEQKFWQGENNNSGPPREELLRAQSQRVVPSIMRPVGVRSISVGNMDIPRKNSWDQKAGNNEYHLNLKQEPGTHFKNGYSSLKPAQRAKGVSAVFQPEQQPNYRSPSLKMVHEHKSYKNNGSHELEQKVTHDEYYDEGKAYASRDNVHRSLPLRTKSTPVIFDSQHLPAAPVAKTSSSFRNDGSDEFLHDGYKKEDNYTQQGIEEQNCNTERLKQDGNIINKMIEMYQRRESENISTTKTVEDSIKSSTKNNFVEDDEGIREEELEDDPTEDNDEEEEVESYSAKKKIVLSTRFSLGGYISNTVKKFAQLLEKHPLFKDYEVYYPNATDKNTCDPSWTNFYHPCRGTFDTCEKEAELKLGIPQEDKCCWRYSFRYQVEHAFVLVQVVEYYHGQFWDYGDDGNSHIIGKAQRIESEMAKDAGTKVFRCFQPTHQVNDTWMKEDFGVDDVDNLAEEVKKWLDDDCANMDECDLEFNYGEDLKCHSLKHRVMYDECMMNECVFFKK